MERYIGLDAHDASCTLAVMGPSGRRLREQRVETTGEAIVEFVKGVAKPRRLVLEEGNLSEWVYELLERHVDELVVTQPVKHAGQKSDAADAWMLADALRRNAIPREVYKAPKKFTALREAVRAYDGTQRDVVRAKNRLNALYRSRGVFGFRGAIYSPASREEWLCQLPPQHRRRAELLSVQLDGLLEARTSAETWLMEEAKRRAAVRRVATAPGIGLVRGAQIVATVVSPHRFRTKRQFWAYCGLGIVARSSNDWKRDETGKWARRNVSLTRGLNRNRNPMLKQAFKNAAHTVVHNLPNHPLHQSYERLLKDTKPNLAQLTIARRIAAAVLAMWKNEEDYDADKHVTAQ